LRSSLTEFVRFTMEITMDHPQKMPVQQYRTGL
jgi:hypothetical protein